MNRLSHQLAFFAPAAVMSAWATVMLHTWSAGHLNRLVSPIFRDYVVVAAALLIVLSLLHLALFQPDTAAPRAVSPRGPFRQLGRWLLLLLPVGAASVLSPSALSSTTEKHRTGSTGPAGAIAMPSMSNSSLENVQEALKADPGQPVPLEVTDLITVSHSPDQIKSFAGRKVRIVGMFGPGATPKLARWIMWCCAADALPASVQLDHLPAGVWKDQQWIEVTGTAQFPSTLGQVIPNIDVESIKPTSEPDEPYLSP